MLAMLSRSVARSLTLVEQQEREKGGLSRSRQQDVPVKAQLHSQSGCWLVRFSSVYRKHRMAASRQREFYVLGCADDMGTADN